MSFSNIFNTSFLILLGIIILSVSLLFIYNETKIREQNHKMNSMLSLVSSLAEETNNMKNTLTVFMMNGGGNNMNILNQVSENRQPFQINKSDMKMENNLITVSDDEDNNSTSDSDSEENNTINETDSESSENESSDNSDSDSDSSISITKHKTNKIKEQSDNMNDNNIKILKINKKLEEKSDSENNSESDEELDDYNDLNDDEIISLGGISLISNSEQIATEAILSLHNMIDNNNIIISLHNFNQESKNDIYNDHDIQILDEDEKKENSEIININKDVNDEVNNYLKGELKSISINQNDLEDKDRIMDNVDFKKLPINKLRNIVSEKGLSADTSKLKKNELLKLLGVE